MAKSFKNVKCKEYNLSNINWNLVKKPQQELNLIQQNISFILWTKKKEKKKEKETYTCNNLKETTKGSEPHDCIVIHDTHNISLDSRQ